MDVRQHVIALNETRLRIANEMQGFIDRINGRDMSAEERAQWDRYSARIDEIDVEVRQFVEREQREQEAAQLRMMHAQVLGGDGDVRGDGFGPNRRESDALRSVLRGEIDPRTGRPMQMVIPMAATIRERELLRAGADKNEIRSLLWDTGNVGSTVPTTLSRTLYEYLEASTAMFRAPTTKINTSSGENMDFPRLTAHSIGTQVIAQGTAIAGTDPGFAKTSFSAYKYGQLCHVANEVVQDSAIDILNWLGRDMGRALGRVIDTDLVVGTGTGEPNGIMTALSGGGAGSVTTGGSLIDPTYEKLVDTVYALTDEYRATGSAGWLLRDSTAGTILKLRDGNGGTLGAPLWQFSQTNGLVNGEPDRLLGYPVFRDPNVASLASNARILAYGDFSAYYVRTVGDIVVERSTDYQFDKDMTSVRAKWRVDGDLMDANALVTMVRNV